LLGKRRKKHRVLRIHGPEHVRENLKKRRGGTGCKAKLGETEKTDGEGKRPTNKVLRKIITRSEFERKKREKSIWGSGGPERQTKRKSLKRLARNVVFNTKSTKKANQATLLSTKKRRGSLSGKLNVNFRALLS